MSLLTAAGCWAQTMLQEEPVLTLAVIQSSVAMLVGFGLSWTGEQVGLVVGFSAAVLGWIARRALKKLGFLAADDIRRFTTNAIASANAMHGGRHAKARYQVPPGREMTLAEANRLFRTLVTKWLEYRTSGPGSGTAG